MKGCGQMISSMTGYGRGQSTYERMTFTAEIKSVNHRYFEFAARIPRGYAFAEDKLKSFCQSKISRGKVDFYLSYEGQAGDSVAVDINEELAGSYVAALRKLRDEYGLADDISVSTVARYNDIFTLTKAEVDEERILAAILSAAESAVEAFLEMRRVEGEKLVQDVLSRVKVILSHVEYIEERSPETVNGYRQRIEQRVRELIGDAQVDEQRLLTETAIFADKVATAEETVRLRSHIEQLTGLLNGDEPAGRKLDFIVQEMNRETNTIGSKAQDVEITRRVVEIKAEIEKIREQIQNIE